MSIRKVVITAAGLGTRLLPMSKEFPKEMLPVYVKSARGLTLKPLLQAIFEQLYEIGIRDFCFVVGRGKRAIEDHFTPDWDYITKLNNKGKTNLTVELINFYNMIENSTILWVNQPEPRGFGHAVLMAKPFVGNESFIVCAGDTYIISKDNNFLKRMIKIHFEESADATLLLQKVSDPRQYGVAITEYLKKDTYKVLKVIEKPRESPSNFAIMPFYVFNLTIMDSLENIKPDINGEIQLTDGIQKLISNGKKVVATLLEDEELRLDVGTPETYWEAMKSSYEYMQKIENHNPMSEPKFFR
ncbi:MAG: sugar phosphate nucleotidyltransferase [Thermoprotei archaeon]